MGTGSSKALNPAAQQFVRDTIAQNRVVIFSKQSCPYCKMAKEQFTKLNVEFTAVEIESRPDTSDLQDVFNEMTGARTVPRVFIDGNFIGGGTDVKKLYDNGELAKMLKID